MFTQKDRQKCQRLFERYYSKHKFHDARYRELIRQYLRPGQQLLDAGCGRYLRIGKEMSGIARVVGIDLEQEFETDNVRQPFGVRGDVGNLPFPSNHFDIVICRSVVEHLADPQRVFHEFFRVLKPGGKVVIVTPNKYDYVSLIAMITPYWIHRALVSRIFQVPADDVFPTLYRANTMSSINRALAEAGFLQRHLDTVNHYPAYLSFSPMLYRLAILYERLTSLNALKSLRGSILCAFEKPMGCSQGALAQEQTSPIEKNVSVAVQ